MKKFIIGFFLFLSMMLLGFLLGGIFAQQYLVSMKDGLAGVTAVVMMGFTGSFIGVVLSILLALNQNERQQKFTSVIVLILTVVVWLFFQFYLLG